MKKAAESNDLEKSYEMPDGQVKLDHMFRPAAEK